MKSDMNRHKPKKSLGQNFLRDLNVVAQILEAAQLDNTSAVVEVGPGEGVLTAPLADIASRVIAIEVDEDLVARLRERFARNDTVVIHHADMRRVYLKELLANYNISRYTVVANLPYYITSSIVRLFMENKDVPPERLVLMVQKEVAQRIVATPGAMSILSVAVQYYGDAQVVCTVPRTAFDPVPNVDSAVIAITHHGVQTSAAEDAAFFRVVRAGFSARRKMMAKNLSSSLGIPRDVVHERMTQCGIATTARAQDLSITQWQCLAANM